MSTADHDSPDEHEPERTAPRVPSRVTSDDEIVDDLVGGLFREVDDRFSHLEEQYQRARKDLTTADVEETLAAKPDPIAASAARYELVQEVTTLRADVERQAAELDERDRLLSELSNRLVGFEDRVRAADEAERSAEGIRQELHEERRELARVRALLEARAAERQELADAAQRLQTDNDDLERRLAGALERFEEVDRVRSQLVEDVAQLEAARTAEADDHQLRHDELVDAKAEVRRLSELVDELTAARDEANKRADRTEHDLERRANEVNYLNRRVESLNERAAESDALEAQIKAMNEEQALLKRQVTDLERDLEVRTAEAQASARAVEAIADRSAQHDQLVARIAELEAAANAAPEPEPRGASELHDLADRARALGARRTSGDYEPLGLQSLPPRNWAAQQAPTAADEQAIDADVASAAAPAIESPTEPVAPESPASGGSELGGVTAEAAAPAIEMPPDAVDAPAIEVPSGDVEAAVPAAEVPSDEVEAPAIEVPSDAVEAAAPAIEMPSDEVEAAVPVVEVPSDAMVAPAIEIPSDEVEGAVPAIEFPADEVETEAPAIEVPVIETPADPVEVDAPTIDIPGWTANPVDEAPPAVPVFEFPAPTGGDATETVDDDAAASTPTFTLATAPIDEPGGRRRLVLPTEMTPDTPEAVEYLLAQPGVTAIVDARSFCGRTGIRPSELFERMEALRDGFDLPVEVVVTPVSTPVGGAPDLPAIGVHHVTGADTVSDRVRALCIGFPPDQQLVVVAGDDHVRRAAIGEEANVVDPAVVIDVT